MAKADLKRYPRKKLYASWFTFRISVDEYHWQLNGTFLPRLGRPR